MREDEIQRELVSAGFFSIGARKFLGYRALVAIALPVLAVWFCGVVLGASIVGVVLLS